LPGRDMAPADTICAGAGAANRVTSFQLIAAEIKKRTGHVVNPVTFATYQFLRILGL